METSPLLSDFHSNKDENVNTTKYYTYDSETDISLINQDPEIGKIESAQYQEIEDDSNKLGVLSTVFLLLNKMVGTGIFSIPSSIYLLTGSVGASILLWTIGGIIAFCGFSVYLEFGLKIPKSGAEKNYLERVYRKPEYLILALFTVNSITLGVSSSNAFAFGTYILYTLGYEDPSPWAARIIAVVALTCVVLIHGLVPSFGKSLFNILGSIKVVVLLGITFVGFAILSGFYSIPNQPHNFTNIFKGTHGEASFGGGYYNYSVALLRILYSYRGWENGNFVLGQIKQPQRTLRIAGPIAIGVVTILYTLCNVAYFAVIPKDVIEKSGAIIAGNFFSILFGDSAASRVLPLLIALSNIGNVLVVAYGHGYMNMEFAKHGLIPFSKVFSSLKPVGAPLAGLFLHWVSSVTILLVPPPGKIYDFIVDLSSYPGAIIATLVTFGLLHLQFNSEKENWPKRPYHSPLLITLIYVSANIFLVVTPWIPPSSMVPGSLPYYLVPLASLFVFAVGTVYWYFWFNPTRKAKIALSLEGF